MEDSDLSYKRKPAFISFLLVYLLCFGISYLLIKNSAAVSGAVVRLLTKLPLLRPYLHEYGLRDLPYGIIVAFPFVVYGTGRLLWNVMTTYEITSSHIRLLAGSLRRKEHIFPLSGMYDMTFTQTLLEAPLGIGSLVFYRGGERIEIKGVYGVKRIVDSIRGKTNAPYR